jgi:hypothetical protein
MLAAGRQVDTAEDFIEKAAAKSNLRPTDQVRCRGDGAMSSTQWLRDVLARRRAHAAQGAPRPTGSAPGSTHSVLTGTSVVLLDFYVVMNCLYVFGVTRNGRGLVYRCLGSGTAG